MTTEIIEQLKGEVKTLIESGDLIKSAVPLLKQELMGELEAFQHNLELFTATKVEDARKTLTGILKKSSKLLEKLVDLDLDDLLEKIPTIGKMVEDLQANSEKATGEMSEAIKTIMSKYEGSKQMDLTQRGFVMTIVTVASIFLSFGIIFGMALHAWLF